MNAMYYMCFFICAMGLCLCNCQSKVQIQKLSMDKANPTSYCYDKSKEEVNEVINYIFSNYKYEGMGFYKFGDFTGKNSVDSLMRVRSNINSRFIVPFGPLGKSKIYLASDGDSLFYFIDCFEIDIDSIDSKKTNVNIITHGANIIYGYERLLSLPNFNRKAKYRRVEPSTIEEYIILLRIGELLGIDDMPNIIYPCSRANPSRGVAGHLDNRLLMITTSLSP